MSWIKEVNLIPFHLCNLIFEFTKNNNALITLMDDYDLLRKHTIQLKTITQTSKQKKNLNINQLLNKIKIRILI
jgi:hypothetical protein